MNFEEKVKKQHLTKTMFVATKDCDRKLWLHTNRTDLIKEACLADKVNMEQGTAVGVLATTVFKNGVLVSGMSNIKAQEYTMELLMKKEKYIFEATFIVDDFSLVKVDVLELNDDGTYDIIEVKSANSVKEEHTLDVAFQKWVLTQSGLSIRNCYIMHMNDKYERGEKLDKNELFVKEEVSADIEDHYNSIESDLTDKMTILASDVEPECDVGSFCKYPNKCPFYDHCHKDINKDSVTKLARLSAVQRQVLKELGIKYIHDIPDSVLEAVKPAAKRKKKGEEEVVSDEPKVLYLTDSQKIQVIAAKNKEKVILDMPKVKELLLDQLVYPLYHLDFEATNKAVPLFVGAKPNQFFVYQLSVDVEQEDGSLVHHEYLHLKSNDPRREVSERLLAACGTSGSITVWNQSFEEHRIREMALVLPDLSDALLALIPRMVDLEDIFKGKYMYHHDLQGSSSIKYVLPFLCPDLNYAALNISNGTDSQAKYTCLMENRYGKEESEQVIKDLLAYNNLDTMAMVRVLRKIKAIIAMAENADSEIISVSGRKVA